MGLFGGINAVNEINSLIAQIERNMNALAPMIELNGMKHTTQSKELTKLVRRDLDRIKDLLNQHSSARIAVYRLKGDKVDSTTLVGFLEMCLKQAESLIIMDANDIKLGLFILVIVLIGAFIGYCLAS